MVSFFLKNLYLYIVLTGVWSLSTRLYIHVLWLLFWNFAHLSRHAWQTQNRLLLKKQSYQGLPCLLSWHTFFESKPKKKHFIWEKKSVRNIRSFNVHETSTGDLCRSSKLYVSSVWVGFTQIWTGFTIKQTHFRLLGRWIEYTMPISFPFIDAMTYQPRLIFVLWKVNVKLLVIIYDMSCIMRKSIHVICQASRYKGCKI